jgi:copper(I)-binding protein
VLAWAFTLGAAPLAVAAAVAPPAAPAAPRPATAASAAMALPEVKEPWIRWLPSELPAGGYVTLINRADREVVLIGASSEAYESIELHHSVDDSGTSRMLRVNRIIISARSTLDFATGGYHLMLLRPTHSVSPGDRVQMTLHYAGGRSQSVDFEVRKPNAGESMPDASHDMPGMKGMKGMKGMNGTKDMKDMKGMPDMPH